MELVIGNTSSKEAGGNDNWPPYQIAGLVILCFLSAIIIFIRKSKSGLCGGMASFRRFYACRSRQPTFTSICATASYILSVFVSVALTGSGCLKFSVTVSTHISVRYSFGITVHLQPLMKYGTNYTARPCSWLGRFCFTLSIILILLTLSCMLSMEPWAVAKKSFRLVWRCHQLLSGFLSNDHLPRMRHQSRLSANDESDSEKILEAVHRSPDI